MAAIHIQVSRGLAIAADTLWPVLGRFSRLPDWFPGIDGFRCSGDTPGSRRDITIGPFQVAQELHAQDDSGFRTVYQVTDGPGIDRDTGFIVTIALEALANGRSRINWQANLAAAPAQFPAGSEAIFAERTRKSYEQALDHLDRLIASNPGLC